MTMAMTDTQVDKGFIDVRNIGVTFGANDNKVVAVENASINVQPGEFVSLIGPSGCGKSTLLSIVAGFQKPTRGEATLDGKAITRPGSDRGVVFQQYSLFPWLSVRKNVEFGLKMAGVEQSKQTPPRARCSISPDCCFENHYPDQLSGGKAAYRHRSRAGDQPAGPADGRTVRRARHADTGRRTGDPHQHLAAVQDLGAVHYARHRGSIFLSDRIYVMTARPGRIKAEIKVRYRVRAAPR